MQDRLLLFALVYANVQVKINMAYVRLSLLSGVSVMFYAEGTGSPDGQIDHCGRTTVINAGPQGILWELA